MFRLIRLFRQPKGRTDADDGHLEHVSRYLDFPPAAGPRSALEVEEGSVSDEWIWCSSRPARRYRSGGPRTAPRPGRPASAHVGAEDQLLPRGLPVDRPEPVNPTIRLHRLEWQRAALRQKGRDRSTPE